MLFLGVSCCLHTHTHTDNTMYAHPDKSERALYEQRRRKGVIRESRDHRLMSRWLMKVHPDVAAEFSAFRTKLQVLNPNRRDLTTSPQFVRFITEKDGTGIHFSVFSRVLCDCKVFMLCFSDTEAPPKFTLKIPLVCASPPTAEPTPTTTAPVAPAPTTTAIVPYATTTFITPCNNPHSLTDAEIDEMLKVLERGSVLPNQTSASNVFDQDLLEVLDMDIGSFIV